jgi:hypothetical protein
MGAIKSFVDRVVSAVRSLFNRGGGASAGR